MIGKFSFGKSFGLLILAAVLATAGLTTVGCNRERVLTDQFLSIPDRAWEVSHQPEMTVHIQDYKGPYQVYVNFRHSDQYRYSNIFLLIHRKQGFKKESERVELTLAEPDGRWTGSHSGNLYTSQQLVWSDYFFPDTGVFVLSLEQNMRENPLKHVVAAGLRIERSEFQ